MANNLAGSNTFLSISPSNHRNNQSISFRGGNPNVQFQIGSQERYLLGHSVRLVGNLSIYKSSTADGFGVIPVDTDDILISSKLGVYGILDSLTISSQTNKSVIESCKHYGHYLASYYGNIASGEEALGHLSVASNMIPNNELQNLSTISNVNGSDATNRNFRGNSFCIQLSSGLLNSKSPIGLSSTWGVGGLNISLNLVPDAQFIYAPSELNTFYQLTDVQLICEVMTPSVDELSKLMTRTSGTMEYNAISSYFTTIGSSNAIINLRLGLSNVLGIFMNFIPSAYLNNYLYDSYQQTPLINKLVDKDIAEIKSVVFQRGGEKVGLYYPLITNANSNASSEIADPDLTRNYMNAFIPFMKNVKTQQSPITNNRKGFDNDDGFADSGQYFGIGFATDNISGQGLDFRNEQFSVSMDTGLTSGLNHSVFMFVRSKQTLVFNKNGLQVIQ